MAGHLHTVRAGELLVLPPDVPHTCGAHLSNPWTIHWAQAVGENLREYLNELGVSAKAPLVWMDDDLQLARLFNEVVRTLEQGSSFLDLLHASHALAHLLAVMIRHRHERTRDTSDSVQKVAEGIIYMSEHLDQPMRVSALAALADGRDAALLYRKWMVCSDASRDPQAYVLTPDSAIAIAQAIVSTPTAYDAGKAAALTAVRLLRDAHRDGALKLHPREVPWLDRLQKTVEALPANETEFISEMMGEVDTTKFVSADYGIG